MINTENHLMALAVWPLAIALICAECQRLALTVALESMRAEELNRQTISSGPFAPTVIDIKKYTKGRKRNGG